MGNSTFGTRLTIWMTVAVLAGFAIILAMNAAAFLGVVPSRYISPNDVRGIAIEHDNKLYTLNFAQQNELVDIFNRFIPVGEELVDQRKVNIPHVPEVQKIIIYRFNKPDLEVIPKAYIHKTTSIDEKLDDSNISIIFSIPEWNSKGLLEESTSDNLYKFLSTTYAP